MDKFKIKIIFIVLLGLLCLSAIIFTWYRKSSALDDYIEVLKHRDRSAGSVKVAPTADNIFVIKKDSEWLAERDQDVKQILAKKNLQLSEMTPLQFKEELLNAQIKFKQLASIQGCTIDETLGFPEYVSGDIPPQGQIKLLLKQLAIIDEVTKIILKHKISEVVSIIRSNDIHIDKENLYNEMAFKININCTIEELLGILKDFVNAPNFLIVRDINIQKLNEDKINVEILFGVVEVNQDTPRPRPESQMVAR
jgi:hypothetical protein